MVGVSFFPALSAGLVWDDQALFRESTVRFWSDLWTVWFSPADTKFEGHYWPILYTTFWLEHKLWGLDPFGYHLVNVLLYMASVVVLWRLLLCLAVPGAWAVAAVFAVHPMHVESVAWIIARKDILSALFCMASALCWIRCMDGVGGNRFDTGDSPVSKDRPPSRFPWHSWHSIRVPRPGLYLLALGLLVAAMLSKSMSVTLPVGLAICLWWKQGRVTWADASRIAPFFVIALGIAAADVFHYTSKIGIELDYGFAERVLIAARALWFYAGKLVWPTDLAVIYPLWDIDAADPLAWGYVIAAAAVAALLWFSRHRLGRGPLAGVLFFAVTLSPTLGFVDFSYMRFSSVADRYAFLAGMGVMAVVIGAAAYGAGKLSKLPRVGAAGALVAVLAVFGKLTWDQAGMYRDGITFWGHIVSLNPQANSAHRNLAVALYDSGRPAEALPHSLIAVKQRPGDAKTHDTQGIALLALDRLDEARECFERALELDPTQGNSHHNMGEVLRRKGRFAESIEWYRGAIDIDSENVAAYYGMGRALSRLGRDEQVVEALERAVSLRPEAVPPGAVHLLAEALLRLERNEEAIQWYRGVLQIDPGFAPAHAGIGYALLGLERYAEAVESLARSVSLEPESPAAADRHVAIGHASLELGRVEAAAEHLERALAIDSRNARALDALALLRFRQQRYDEALRLYEMLIDIGEGGAQVHANLGATLHYLGRPEEALRSLERARALDPTLEMAGTGVEESRGTSQQEQE